MNRLLINPNTLSCPACSKRRAFITKSSIEYVSCIEHPEFDDNAKLHIELSKIEALISFQCDEDSISGFNAIEDSSDKIIAHYPKNIFQSDRMEIGLIFSQLVSKKIQLLGIKPQLEFFSDAKNIIRYKPFPNTDFLVLLSAYLNVYNDLKALSSNSYSIELSDGNHVRRRLEPSYNKIKNQSNTQVKARRIRA